MNYIIGYFILGIIWALAAEKMSTKYSRSQSEEILNQWNFILRLYFIVLWPITLSDFLIQMFNQSKTPNDPGLN